MHTFSLQLNCTFRKYAKALLELGVNKVKLSACPIAFGEVSIKTRIKSVINYKKASKFLVLASLCLCIGVSVCFMTEPEVPLKEKAEEAEVEEVTTEPVTEKVTEPIPEPTTAVTTEPQTEPVTEPETEAVTQVYEPVEEPTVDYEEVNSIIASKEAEMLEEFRRRDTLLMEEANKNSQSNLGSNSSVIGTKPSYTPDLPDVTLFPADSTPTYNYGNTNHPHFEGNQWVYN